ncbi:hypothetical protein F9C11_21675 [Amycolatopsis sp. VS8301801F10]|uniref:hypothetical protein n=1 Tax=Amycolatopsis sp. VS8301801F10 TaxID=2652442 RepID=UPI0038FC30AB
MNDYSKWVRDGQRVEARYATGSGVHATGYVYAYADRPTVHIVQPDGGDLSWIADLCVPVDGGSNDARNAALAKRGTGGTVSAAASQLEREVAYWQARAEAAEKRLKDAAEFYPDNPPEPPVGTQYLRRDGTIAWERREDGWRCGRPDCYTCPTDWSDALDSGISEAAERKLP